MSLNPVGRRKERVPSAARGVMTGSPRLALAYVVLGIGASVSLLSGPVLDALWPNWRGQHLPLHSSLEAVSGLASIAMALVLFQRGTGLERARHQMLGAGLLGMGVLDVFHATALPGNGFVLLRNMAGLAGGIGFALVWLPASGETTSRRSWIVWLIGIGAVGVGAWTLLAPGQVPEMIRNGRFTPTAVAPQSLASILFLAATWQLLATYRRTGASDDYLLACLALLFALAELVFMYSVPWDARWWFWHGLRFTASVLMLGYLALGSLRMVAELQDSLILTKQTEDTLRASERRLRETLDERQRMAENLHDGAIQTIFAITLSLERCRRQYTVNPAEAAGQLESAVKDLKAVIRDLRGYLAGLEPMVGGGRELEAALTLLVRGMNNPNQLQFQLAVTPQAAERVTAEQAGELMAIVREAMSNSVRHSDGRSGTVSLGFHDRHVRLVVEDDGRGFEASELHQRGYGLKHMAARARKLGGSLEIISGPGRGTRIVLDLSEEPHHVQA